MANFFAEETEIEERVVAINRVAKVVKGGRRFNLTALVAAGDRNGNIGIGRGKGSEVPLAIRKASTQARKSMVRVYLRGNTIPHEVIGKFGAAQVLLKPASPGTGIIAGGPVRAIVELAGIKDILAKSLGSPNPINLARATLDGLNQLRSAADVAQVRGVKLRQVAEQEKLEKIRQVQREAELKKLKEEQERQKKLEEQRQKAKAQRRKERIEKQTAEKAKQQESKAEKTEKTKERPAEQVKEEKPKEEIKQEKTEAKEGQEEQEKKEVREEKIMEEGKQEPEKIQEEEPKEKTIEAPEVEKPKEEVKQESEGKPLEEKPEKESRESTVPVGRQGFESREKPKVGGTGDDSRASKPEKRASEEVKEKKSAAESEQLVAGKEERSSKPDKPTIKEEPKEEKKE